MKENNKKGNSQQMKREVSDDNEIITGLEHVKGEVIWDNKLKFVKNRGLYVKGRHKYKKSNFLIQSKYKSTIFERELLSVSLEILKEGYYTDKNNNIIVEFAASDVFSTLGITNRDNIYKKLTQVVPQMMKGHVLGIIDPNTQEFDFINLIVRSAYKNGKIRIYFNPYLKDFLIEYDKNFTILDSQEIAKFLICSGTNGYGEVLYEHLLSHMYEGSDAQIDENTWQVEYEIYELRFILGDADAHHPNAEGIIKKTGNYKAAFENLPKKAKKHVEYREFRRQVIDVAVEQINEVTRHNVQYDTLKGGIGGAVKSVVFTITPKANVITDDIVDGIKNSTTIQEADYEEIEVIDKDEIEMEISDMIEEKLKIRDVRAIAEAANYDIERVKKAYEVANQQKNIEKFVPWMIAAINNNYEPSTVSKRGNKNFKNFKQRDYDYDELEKKLLGK